MISLALFALNMSQRILITFFVLFSVACSSAELRSVEDAPREIIADGRCPDLSGVYREQGISVRRQQRTQDAHLSWLIGGEKIHNAKRPLNTPPGPGKQSIFFVETIRVSHPAPGEFTLEALDREGVSMGEFSFGARDGWQCGEGDFFIFRKDQGGGEATWGDRVALHKLYRASDGVLVRSVREWYQQRSVFSLGNPVGPPQSINVEYRFSPASR